MARPCIALAASLVAVAALNPSAAGLPRRSRLGAAVADPVDKTVASREAFDKVVQKTYGRYPVVIVRRRAALTRFPRWLRQ